MTYTQKKFSELPLGTRFKYTNDSEMVYVVLQNYGRGLVCPVGYLGEPNTKLQPVYSFGDHIDQLVWADVITDRAAIHRRVLAQGMDGHDVVGPTICTVPPPGWVCTRAPGHGGPCAAIPAAPPSPAIPAAGGDAGSGEWLTTVRDLDRISMQFGADLAQMHTDTIKGVDYLQREFVMERLMAWRREWDANSKARPAIDRALNKQEPTA